MWTDENLREAMDPLEQTKFDDRRVTSESRRFAEELFARFPELRRHAAMERSSGQETWSLVVEVPSPSGDPRNQMTEWVEGGDDPSVEFGDWHTHENVWGAGLPEGAERATLLDLIGDILADRYVLCEDVGGTDVGGGTILDPTREDALLEELTSPGASGRVRLRSWSGRLDREVGLEDLERRGRA